MLFCKNAVQRYCFFPIPQNIFCFFASNRPFYPFYFVILPQNPKFLEKILDEHDLTVNYLSPNVTRQIGKILGVDVLLVGEITSYLPEQKTMLYRMSKHTTSTPVYNTQVTKEGDGKVKIRQTYGGQDFRQSREAIPTEYTIYAQVGVVAKMLDVNTAEIIWVGDDTQEGISGLDALDSSAKSIIKSFNKQVKKAREKSL